MALFAIQDGGASYESDFKICSFSAFVKSGLRFAVPSTLQESSLPQKFNFPPNFLEKLISSDYKNLHY